MNLRVIEGGRDSVREVTGPDMAYLELRVRQSADVRREADRRLQKLDYMRLHTRQLATGIPMPREIFYLAMQIEFVAKALASLADIPADYRSDAYWPV
jgi:hypothetical protein